ncbi:MAG: undecaprenyl-diphosphate phosphatase [Clostridiales Family XIII bacterium]|jgi:undecaprenyl-diphosphatase|nr:undecaprenyl-diphosphate phosphatase [Clostridiales Family XIII bacterium]
MSIWKAIILGLVQGLAEFLPISSSGHLAILQHYLGIDASNALVFTVLLHLGTLVAVSVAYRRDIAELIVEFVRMIGDIFTGKGPGLRENDMRKLAVMILVATIPAAVCGVLFDSFIARVFTSIILIGVCLIITGTALFVAERIASGKRDLHRANFRNAFTIGLFQAIALLPGISRSGSTIVGGLVLGFKRDLAVRFAFLISIPTVLGAVVLEIPDAIKAGITGDMFVPALIGIIVSAVSGFIAIKAMIRVVTSDKLMFFSIYTWAVGAIVIVTALFHVGGTV